MEELFVKARDKEVTEMSGYNSSKFPKNSNFFLLALAFCFSTV